MISSKLTQNFSFNKLRNKIDDILDEITDGIGENTSKSMINRIEKGLRPKLAEWTLINNAREGITRISNKPLMKTGALLKSLEYDKKKNEINMLAYGKKQNDGYENPWKGFRDVPARKFMDFGIKDTKKQIKSDLYAKIKRTLRK